MNRIFKQIRTTQRCTSLRYNSSDSDYRKLDRSSTPKTKGAWPQVIDTRSKLHAQKEERDKNAPPKIQDNIPKNEEDMTIKQKIYQQIKLSGPISIATYMQQCNTGEDKAGYYMSRDPLGEEGDFITSPEVSQIFGELVGTWCVHEFMCNGQSANSNTPLKILELGPGRGTMMSDILRIIQYLKKYLNQDRKVEINLVEVSEKLKDKQKETLDKYIQEEQANVTVNWYNTIDEVPFDEGVPEYILAHEFFDALPIYKMKMVDVQKSSTTGSNAKVPIVGDTKQELREILIDIDPTTQNNFRYVVAPNRTPASSMVEQVIQTDGSSLSSRGFKEFEVNFQAGAIFSQLCHRVNQTGGCGLVMDYGYTKDFKPDQENQGSIDTFRGYKDHKMVDPLKDSGNVDLTSDIDFDFLAKSVLYIDDLYNNIRFAGPLTQRVFLKNMGIDARLNNLLQENKDSKTREKIVRGYEYITDNEKMGKRFKVMAVMHKGRAEYQEIPITGFHSDVDVTDR